MLLFELDEVQLVRPRGRFDPQGAMAWPLATRAATAACEGSWSV
jgi:hypothetical protein